MPESRVRIEAPPALIVTWTLTVKSSRIGAPPASLQCRVLVCPLAVTVTGKPHTSDRNWSVNDASTTSVVIVGCAAAAGAVNNTVTRMARPPRRRGRTMGTSRYANGSVSPVTRRGSGSPGDHEWQPRVGVPRRRRTMAADTLPVKRTSARLYRTQDGIDQGGDHRWRSAHVAANPAPTGRIRAQNMEATTGIEPVYAVLQTAP
jgi:hypothetical protein